jgi:hypothetical protein
LNNRHENTYLDEYGLFIMGFFGKSKYEKHEEKLSETLSVILNDELEVSELKSICRDLVGSIPKDGMKLIDKDDEVVREFEEPISRQDYCDFYLHYDELEEVNDKMLARYLIKHDFLDEEDEDYLYVTEHTEDDEDKDDDQKDHDNEKDDGNKSSDYMMDSIILKLEKNFEPEKVIDEKELQNLLRSFLQQVFPNAIVEREVQLKDVRDSVDILVDKKYAIEVKIPDNRIALRNAYAQLKEYQEEFPSIIVFILDNEGKNLTDDIITYTKKYRTELGIESVIKIGQKRG